MFVLIFIIKESSYWPGKYQDGMFTYDTVGTGSLNVIDWDYVMYYFIIVIYLFLSINDITSFKICRVGRSI